MKRVHFVRKKGIHAPWVLLFVLLSGFFLLNSLVATDSFAASQLSNDDCVKCHKAVQDVVDSKGAKHKTAVSCMNCHTGHPPMVSKDKIIPACSQCHAGKAHYELKGCNTCHTDPHAPLSMKLAANLTGPCLSCHSQQGKEMKENPSRHSKLFCTTCHKAHKEVPSCLACHQAHTDTMVNKDCLICHPAHRPLVITYGQDVPNSSCAGCHKGIATMLTKSDTKHTKLTCVYCHKDKHRFVPACETCHGTPHPAAMIAKFPKCNMCHSSAHSLGKEATK